MRSTTEHATTVRRGTRRWPPPPPAGDVVVAAPPEVADDGPGGRLQAVLPVLGAFGMLGYAVVSGSLAFVVVGLLTAGLAVAGGLLLRRAQRVASVRRAAARRSRYLRHLDDRAATLRAAADSQRRHQEDLYPPPGHRRGLVAAVDGLWWRRPGDPDFGTARLGTGAARPVAAAVLESGGPLACPEPELRTAAERLVTAFGTVADTPLTLDLLGLGTVVLAGPAAPCRALARALLLDLCVSHGPDDLRIAGCAPAAEVDWVTWVPHARDGARPAVTDATGTPTRVDPSPSGAWTLVLLDRPPSGVVPPAVGARVSHLVLVDDPRDAPGRAGAVLSLDRDGALHVRESGPAGRRWTVARPDRADLDEAAATARALAPLRPATAAGPGGDDGTLGLLDLLGAGPDVDVRTCWRPADGDGLLRAVIGRNGTGAVVAVDLKEPAAGGDGPHGLVVGATGSGKSELLRTLVVSLALGHAPDQLAVLMVDFKGGAAFADLAGLPHSAGLVTNLEEDPVAVERFAAALTGEVTRRQAVLRDAGAGEGVGAYRALRGERPELPPLPSLLVVVDEFAELLAAHPDLHDLIATLGRVGRSLGIHLLLASQRVDEGRLLGLSGHLRYRVCLRTSTAAESRATIGSDDAHRLPATPGRGFLSVDGRTTAVRIAPVGLPPAAPVVTPFRAGIAGEEAAGPRGVAVTRGEVSGVPGRSAAGRGSGVAALVAALADGAAAAGHSRPRQVVTPPLPPVVALRDVLAAGSRLRVPVGRLDLPGRHEQPALVLDLRGDGGNVAVVGAPRSGRSTLLTTLALGIAATHDPADVQIYAVDLGGGGLAALTGVPHVGAVCGRHDDDLLRALAEQIRQLVADRLRRAVPGGSGSAARRDGYGEVVVLVDNWGRLRGRHDDVEEILTEVAGSGLEVGVHLVVSAGRWGDLRPAVRDTVGTRLELRLNDPVESEVGRRLAGRLPRAVPGRGLTSAGDTFQTAVAVDAAGRPVVAPLGTRRAPPVLLLPTTFTLPDDAGRTGTSLLLGVSRPALGPSDLDLLADEPLLLVLGDSRSGRTTVLRGLHRQLDRRDDRDGIRVHVVDPRGTLGAAGADSYARTPAQAADLATALRDGLADRAAVPWSGPRHVLLVDDHDLIAGPGSSPLSALAHLLPVAADVGLSVVLTRRTGGFARSAFEPMLARFGELGTPALVLSGDPGEGPVHGGVVPRPLCPGRAQLVRRGVPPVLTQLALPPAGPGEAAGNRREAS